jgi:hypothetical protein
MVLKRSGTRTFPIIKMVYDRVMTGEWLNRDDRWVKLSIKVSGVDLP